MDDLTKECLRIIIEAAKSLDARYINFLTASSEEPIFRERVFCYELYHQMRCRMDDKFVLNLNGEVDKRSHNDFSNEVPDFIFHKNGTHEFNSIILEVKCSLSTEKVENDFRKLLRFTKEKKYKLGIWLLFGNECNTLIQNAYCTLRKIKETLEFENQYNDSDFNKIRCFILPEHGRFGQIENPFNEPRIELDVTLRGTL